MAAGAMVRHVYVLGLLAILPGSALAAPPASVLGLETGVHWSPSDDINVTWRNDKLGYPKVAGVSPMQGPVDGGTVLNISGFDLGSSTADVQSVTIGNVSCGQVSWANINTLQCTTTLVDAPVSGPITVITSKGRGISLVRFVYNIPPHVTGVTPTNGKSCPGGTLKLEGKFLGRDDSDVVSITVAGVPVEKITYFNPSLVMATLPALPIGKQDVIITTKNGGTTRVPKAYTVNPRPATISISPHEGPLVGGTKLRIMGENMGRNLQDLKSIKLLKPVPKEVEGNATQPPEFVWCTNLEWFSSIDVSCTVQGSDKVFTGNVVVTTQSGCDGDVVYTKNRAAQPVTRASFTYRPKPWIDFVKPRSGPMAGGTELQVVGSFLGANAKDIKSIEIISLADGTASPCVNLKWTSSKWLVCTTTAAQNYGAADMRITTVVHGVSEKKDKPIYQFNKRPTVRSVSPMSLTLDLGLKDNVVVVTGDDMGTTNKDIVNVTVGGALCHSHMKMPDGSVQCTFGECHPPCQVNKPAEVVINTLSGGKSTTLPEATVNLEWNLYGAGELMVGDKASFPAKLLLCTQSVGLLMVTNPVLGVVAPIAFQTGTSNTVMAPFTEDKPALFDMQEGVAEQPTRCAKENEVMMRPNMGPIPVALMLASSPGGEQSNPSKGLVIKDYKNPDSDNLDFSLCSAGFGLLVVGARDGLGDNPFVEAFLYASSARDDAKIEMASLAQAGNKEVFGASVLDTAIISKDNRVEAGLDCSSGRMFKMSLAGSAMAEGPPAKATALLAANWVSEDLQRDVLTFRDEKGLKCKDWEAQGTCLHAAAKDGYSAEGQEELLRNCPASCKRRATQGKVLAKMKAAATGTTKAFTLCGGSSGLLMVGGVHREHQVAQLVSFSVLPTKTVFKTLQTVGGSNLYNFEIVDLGAGTGFTDGCYNKYREIGFKATGMLANHTGAVVSVGTDMAFTPGEGISEYIMN